MSATPKDKKKKEVKEPKLPDGWFKLSDARCMSLRKHPDIQGMYQATAEFSNKPWVLTSSFDFAEVFKYSCVMAKSWELDVEVPSEFANLVTPELKALIPPKNTREYEVKELPEAPKLTAPEAYEGLEEGPDWSVLGDFLEESKQDEEL
jgi:hypothetical protein